MASPPRVGTSHLTGGATRSQPGTLPTSDLSVHSWCQRYSTPSARGSDSAAASTPCWSVRPPVLDLLRGERIVALDGPSVRTSGTAVAVTVSGWRTCVWSLLAPWTPAALALT